MCESSFPTQWNVQISSKEFDQIGLFNNKTDLNVF